MILAGAGGVGHLAVQFASAYGAEVVATASPDNHGFLHALGARWMVDYHDANWPARVVAEAGQVDLVLDLVGGESGKAALACVKPGGRLVTVPTITAQQIKDAGAAAGIEVVGMLVHPDQKQLGQMLMLLRQGEVKVTLAGEFPLAEGALAHQAIEGGHVRGKLLLRMPAADGYARMNEHYRDGAGVALFKRIHLRYPAARQLRSAAGGHGRPRGSGA